MLYAFLVTPFFCIDLFPPLCYRKQFTCIWLVTLLITTKPNVLYSYTLMYMDDILSSLFLFVWGFSSALYSTNLFVPLLWCWAATHVHTLPSLHPHLLPQKNIQITGQLLAKHYSKPSLCQGLQGFYDFTSFLAQLFVSSLPWTPLLVSSFPLVLTPLALYSSP